MKTSRNNLYKLIKLFLVVSLLILAFTGCSVIEQIAEYNLERLYEEKEEVIDDTIYLPESTYVKDAIELTMVDPKSLNPIEPLDYTIDQVLKLLYQPILKMNENSVLENDLVREYEKVTEKVYRFTISEEAFFHNGLPLESKDIIYTYDLISKSENTPYSYALKYIEAITEINEKVFEVKFYTLDYFNLYALTFPIVSKEYLTSNDYDPLLPIGSGPYMYEDFQSMLRFDLIRNPNYMYEKAKAKRVTVNIIRNYEDDYNMFLSKRIDIHSPKITLWESYSDDRKIQIYNYDSPMFYYFGINHDEYLLNDSLGRRLVASSIPYGDIQKDAFLNHLNPTVLPVKSTHVLSQNMDPYVAIKDNNSYYNYLYKREMIPTYVKQLRDAGNTMIDYTPVTLDLVYNTNDYYANAIVEVLKDNKDISQIIYNYVALDTEGYKLALETKNYDLYIGVIKTGIIPDLASIYSSTGELNIGGYNSINFNGLLSTYRKVSNEEQFINQLENLSKVATDELPLIPLGFLENGVFVHEFVGLGAKPNAFKIYYGLEGLEIINK